MWACVGKIQYVAIVPQYETICGMELAEVGVFAYIVSETTRSRETGANTHKIADLETGRRAGNDRRGEHHLEILDLTGKPAGYSTAFLGKRISWQQFREVTKTKDRPEGCPIPEGATLRGKQPPPYREPRPPKVYWAGGECRFASRYTDPSRENRGFPKKPPLIHVSKTMVELLRPLSAKIESRFVFRSESVRSDVTAQAATMRLPIAEEHSAGRISARHMQAADWFQEDVVASASAKVEGVRMRTPTGSMLPCGSRDPLALWPAEASADRAIRLRWRFRTLGPLARIVWHALNGAEIAELAPAWKFSQRNIAEAGRIRLRAGLELCARMAEREVDKLPAWEVLEVTRAACAECAKLEATRRMRILIPANDNRREIPQRIAA